MWLSVAYLVLGAVFQPLQPVPPINQLDRSNVQFRFGPASTPGPQGDLGVAGTDNVCTWLNANGLLTGNYFCMRGDGTQISSSAATMSAVGSPTTLAAPHCGSGVNCPSLTGQRLSSGNVYASGNVSSPTDMTMCAMFQLDATPASTEQMLIAKDDVSTHRMGWLEYDTAGQTSIHICKSNISCQAAGGAASAPTAGAVHVACGTYHFVADGTSLLTDYFDGVQVQQVTTGIGPLNAISYPYSIGDDKAGGPFLPMTGRVFWAFETDQALTSTQVSSISNMSLGALSSTGIRDSYGNAITFTRASTATCPSSDGSSVSIVPSGKACITGGGLRVRPATTNLAQFYNSVGSAPWATSQVVCSFPSLSTNSTDLPAPDGTFTATKVGFSSCSGANVETVYQNFTVTNTTAYTQSIWARTLSGTATFNLMNQSGFGTTGTWVTCSADSTAWTRCSATATTSTTSWYMQMGYDGRGGFGTALPTANVYVWGGQMETGSVANDVCPTAGASATCLGEAVLTSSAISFPGPGSSLSASADILSYSFSAINGPEVVDISNSTTDTFQLELDSAGHLQCFFNYGGVSHNLVSTTVCSTNTLCHVACLSNGTTVTNIVNGVPKVFTSTNTASSATYTVRIGNYVGSGFQATGNVSNVCVSASPWGCQ